MPAIRNKHTVTFIPPNEAAYIIGDFTNWKRDPLPLNSPLTLELPTGAYVEYAFLDREKRPLADPNNLHKPDYPWHDYDRCITLPHNPFVRPPRSFYLRGRLMEHILFSRAFQDQRTFFVYEPPLPATTTLFVQDGQGFCQGLKMHEITDVLIEQQRIVPIRLVLAEPRERYSEYWFCEAYERFLLEELLSEIDRLYGATPTQAFWGASLGGLTAIWLAWKHPAIFMKVGCQSGCFKAHPDRKRDEYTAPEWITEQFANTDLLPLRIYLQTGQIEWLLAANRRFAAILADKGYPHKYEELPSGHTWATWEQGLAPGLEYLFGV